jgi:hypothetical protein
VNESAGQGEQRTASGGIVLRPGEGRTSPGTDAITLKATSEETGGSVGFLEATSAPGTEPGKVLAAYIPGGLERSFEEFAQLRTAEQGEDANRSTGQGRTVAEINEKYDSEFVGPPL